MNNATTMAFVRPALFSMNKDKKIRIRNGNNGLCTKREARHSGQSDGL